MPAELLLIGLSLLLRLGTFGVVMNYVNVSRHRIAWWLIAAAMMLMALENVFQLLGHAGLSDLAYRSNISLWQDLRFLS